MTTAKFTADLAPSSPPGVDVVGGETIDLQLEDQPALDVLSCSFSVRGTSGAPAATVSNGGVASPPQGVVVLTIPASDGNAHSWLVECTVVTTSIGASGVATTTTTKSARLFAMRNGNGARKMIALEVDSYDEQEGWVEAFNSLVDSPGIDPDVISVTPGPGGAVNISGTAGAVPGTDLAGPIRLSHGRHIADGSTAEVAGYYADATGDNFENKLWAIKRNNVSRTRFDTFADSQWSSTGFIDLLTHAGAGEFLVSNTQLFGYCGAGGARLLAAGGTCVLESTGACIVSTYAREFRIAEGGGVYLARNTCWIPVDVTTTDAVTTTTVAALTLSATRPSFVRASVRVWDAAFNVKTFDVKAGGKGGGGAALVGTPVIVGDGDAGLAAATLVVDVNAGSMRFRANGVAATTLAWSVTAWEER
jgi:hypothetical protein